LILRPLILRPLILWPLIMRRDAVVTASQLRLT